MLISLIFSKHSYRGSFKFDRRFLNKPMVREAILKGWNLFSVRFQEKISVANILRTCRKELSKLKRENNSNSRDRIVQIQVALEVEQSKDLPSI